MTTMKGRVLTTLALWATEYDSPEHHDSDEVAQLGDLSVTVGMLRSAYRHYLCMAKKPVQQRQQEAA